MQQVSEIIRIIKENAVPDEMDIAGSRMSHGSEQLKYQGIIDLTHFAAQKEEMNASWNLTADFAITSRGGLAGRLIILFKRLVRKSIGWYVRPIVQQQQTFNAAATRAVNEAANVLVNMNALLQRHEEREKQMLQKLGKLMANRAQLVRLVQDGDHRQGAQTAGGRRADSVDFNQLVRVGLDADLFDYVAFERQFRGEGIVLEPHQKMYVHEFRHCESVVDLGCGHGDFLHALQIRGISARGCDLNASFVEACRARGLDVELTDALTYLKKLEKDSIDGILISQVVEHMNYDELILVLREAHLKLRAGGKIIIVTLNPQNVTTFTNAFYVDPTHIRMIHPETLKFILGQNGFVNIDKHLYSYSKIDYEVPLLSGANIDNLADFNNGIQEINKLLFGYQDYTIIALKE